MTSDSVLKPACVLAAGIADVDVGRIVDEADAASIPAEIWPSSVSEMPRPVAPARLIAGVAPAAAWSSVTVPVPALIGPVMTMSPALIVMLLLPCVITSCPDWVNVPVVPVVSVMVPLDEAIAEVFHPVDSAHQQPTFRL